VKSWCRLAGKGTGWGGLVVVIVKMLMEGGRRPFVGTYTTTSKLLKDYKTVSDLLLVECVTDTSGHCACLPQECK
jgi:hypothetical protein